MWLIACQDEDEHARWIADGLARCGLESVEVLTASELALDAVWEHRVGGADAQTVLRVGERTIDSADVDGVLNRLEWLSAYGYTGASDEDREYATAELQALALSWLAGLGERVLNRPLAPGLGAGWIPSCQWRSAALHAGLRVAPYASNGPGFDAPGSERLLVVDGQAPHGDPPSPAALDVRALACAIGLDVFEAQFLAGSDEAWELAEIDPLPELDEVAVEALACALRAAA